MLPEEDSQKGILSPSAFLVPADVLATVCRKLSNHQNDESIGKLEFLMSLVLMGVEETAEELSD